MTYSFLLPTGREVELEDPETPLPREEELVVVREENGDLTGIYKVKNLIHHPRKSTIVIVLKKP